MTNKRHIFTNILEWLLIIISVVSVWMGGYIAGLKFHEIKYHTPNVVSVEPIKQNAPTSDLGYLICYDTFRSVDFLSSNSSNGYSIFNNISLYLHLEEFTITNIYVVIETMLSDPYPTTLFGSTYQIEPNYNTLETFDYTINCNFDINNFNQELNYLFYSTGYSGNYIDFVISINGENFHKNLGFFYYVPFSSNLVVCNFSSSNSTFLTIDNVKLIQDFYDNGYNEGMNSWEQNTEFTDNVLNRIWNIITSATVSVFNVLNFQVLPGIPLFAIVVLPIIIAIILFVFKVISK